MEVKEFCAQLNIVDIIGSFIPLKKIGINYQGICPFHNEKTPSFVVNENKQIFKCFGCGAGGDVLGFFMQYKNLEFKDAVCELSQMYNLANPLKNGKRESEYKNLQEKLENLSKIFVSNLLDTTHEIPNKLRGYLENRGFEADDITRFSFGYCKGDEWKQFFSLDEAIKVGIVSQKGFCLFTNRLTITLFNGSYKPIGFVGRTHPYFNFRNSPKYINSKESVIYSKSKNLYNFARARNHIQRTKKVLIVEGYMDALSAWKMGIKDCVATGGTAFNKTFLAQIANIDPEITFLFDNDEAGQKNTLNAIRVCIENGYINVYKGNLLNEVKDLGEVLESKLKTKITKKNGISYYLKDTIDRLDSVKEKDSFVKQWSDFVLKNQNHFLRIELIEITKKALGIDISKQNINAQAKQDSILDQVFSSIINSKECAYIASELIKSDELGEYTQSYHQFCQGVLDDKAQRANVGGQTLSTSEFVKALFFVLHSYYDKLIENAKTNKDFIKAREFVMKKQELAGF